ncbi:class I SAM-dependent methyltransferase [Amaricoccus sp. W119]|uniref:class I SAM-dependent methyltransferase n=1 Tax=Amaricoccus sp. W119 TaxID=3391833 RepID=UPI0039A60C0C
MTGRLIQRVASDFLAACERIESGRLRVRTPEGHVHDFGGPGGSSGPGGSPGPGAGSEAELRIRDWAAVTALRARGDIGFAEAYVAGLWDTPGIEPLVSLALRDEAAMRTYSAPSPLRGMGFRLLDRIVRRNSIAGSGRNVRAHYDLGNEFYGEWLDPGFTYSSALFAESDTDLARGQARKYDRILDRLGGRERVLEIGCGWGGFADRAVGRGHAVDAITLSPAQKAYADARLDGRAKIELRDYRRTSGRYPAIVSIEMIEAVGERYWPTYFATLRDRLADEGAAVIQAITVADDHFPAYRRSTDYIRHAIFPGGMLLCERAIVSGAARAGLRAAEPFAFGQHYALTCRQWASRLVARSGRLASLGYGEATLRHWRYYLEACAATFAVGRANVVQVELTHA